MLSEVPNQSLLLRRFWDRFENLRFHHRGMKFHEIDDDHDDQDDDYNDDDDDNDDDEEERGGERKR